MKTPIGAVTTMELGWWNGARPVEGASAQVPLPGTDPVGCLHADVNNWLFADGHGEGHKWQDKNAIVAGQQAAQGIQVEGFPASTTGPDYQSKLGFACGFQGGIRPELVPKSSPKRIETKKQSSTFGRDAGFSGATVKFPALTALFRRKLLSNKHFLRSAFYRGGFHRSLAHPPTRHALLWAAPRSLASATQTPPKPFASV